jgi:hypothetical protein
MAKSSKARDPAILVIWSTETDEPKRVKEVTLRLLPRCAKLMTLSCVLPSLTTPKAERELPSLTKLAHDSEEPKFAYPLRWILS